MDLIKDINDELKKQEEAAREEAAIQAAAEELASLPRNRYPLSGYMNRSEEVVEEDYDQLNEFFWGSAKKRAKKVAAAREYAVKKGTSERIEKNKGRQAITGQDIIDRKGKVDKVVDPKEEK